jgi:hypothetical protein
MMARDHETRASFRAVQALLTALVVVGCSTSAQPELQPADGAEAIVGGGATFAYPAVGVTVNGDATGCSATLVRANVIMLAGHCFEAGRTEIRPWQFEIRRSNQDRRRYPTGRGWVTSRDAPGEDDVALLRLETAVPASVARPLALASDYPAAGSTMRMIGFGCTVRDGSGAGAGQKRVVSFGWGESSESSCPGDSGGALIAFPSSRVVGVISGFHNAERHDDIFAWVPKHYEDLEAQIAALER